MTEAAKHRSHWRMRPPGVARFIIAFFCELAANVPAMLALRARYRAFRSGPRPAEPAVVWVGDNLDEVNGIALSARILLGKLREAGKQVFLFGVAFHSRPPRAEGPDDAVILAPGRFSLEQAGYHESEIVVIRLAHFIRFLSGRRIDLIEFQTPGAVAALCYCAARIAGIKTLSHYRTDILTYTRLLVDNRFGIWFINSWTQFFTRLTGPVIVPSEAYREKVEAMGVRPERIFQVRRGVDLAKFHPDKGKNGAWKDFGLPESGVRLLYVGRISKEKNLALLADAVPELLREEPEISLTFVGDGPFRAALQERLAGHPRVRFTGVVQGDKLAALFASADIFVFPSLTDTFGNSVVEALASGVPCVTSGEGGPREIIVDGECGLIFDHRRPGDLREKILALARDPGKLSAFKGRARERALEFAYDAAARSFWDFYAGYHNDTL